MTTQKRALSSACECVPRKAHIPGLWIEAFIPRVTEPNQPSVTQGPLGVHKGFRDPLDLASSSPKSVRNVSTESLCHLGQPNVASCTYGSCVRSYGYKH